ncbi:MAG: enoyl-CoA hydratase/isomerase family protein [Sciscionella sp.]
MTGLREALRLELDDSDPVATLTIDRQQKRNAMSFEMWSALPGIAKEVASSSAKVLIVRGGEHFSAGADISEFATLRAGQQGARRYADAVHAGERALAELSKPTIAELRGFCVGGGCEIALACDIRIAAEDALFGVTPAKLGLVYNFTSTRQLVHAVGAAWAKQILFSGELVDAATALRIGLVNELHPAEQVPARAAELARTIAGRARLSVRGAKNIVNRISSGADVEDADVEALYDEAHASDDYREGVQAFLDKRPPRFA